MNKLLIALIVSITSGCASTYEGVSLVDTATVTCSNKGGVVNYSTVSKGYVYCKSSDNAYNLFAYQKFINGKLK